MSRHIGYYAKWSRCIMMHHSIWIRRRWKDFLPVLNQMQKVLTNKVSDLAEVCERNMHTVDFLLAIAAVQSQASQGCTDETEVSDSEEDLMEVPDDNLEALASKWSDDDE